MNKFYAKNKNLNKKIKKNKIRSNNEILLLD